MAPAKIRDQALFLTPKGSYLASWLLGRASLHSDGPWWPKNTFFGPILGAVVSIPTEHSRLLYTLDLACQCIHGRDAWDLCTEVWSLSYMFNPPPTRKKRIGQYWPNWPILVCVFRVGSANIGRPRRRAATAVRWRLSLSRAGRRQPARSRAWRSRFRGTVYPPRVNDSLGGSPEQRTARFIACCSSAAMLCVTFAADKI